MKEQKKQIVVVSQILTIIGFSLCIGSIASFIAMNVITPKTTLDLDFTHWQRYFAKPITNYVTVPGIWLFVTGNIGLYLFQFNKDNLNTAILIVAMLTFINGIFVIVPTARIVNRLAFEQAELARNVPLFLRKKMFEDSCGGINLFLLITYLTLTVIQIRKKLPTANKALSVKSAD